MRSDTCLLSMHEPRNVKDALENVDWSKAMKEEIDRLRRIRHGLYFLDKKIKM